MKKLILAFMLGLFLISMVSATNAYDTHNRTFNDVGPDTAFNGFWFFPNGDITINEIVVNDSVGATNCSLWDSSSNVLASASVVNNNATLNYAITSGSKYAVACTGTTALRNYVPCGGATPENAINMTNINISEGFAYGGTTCNGRANTYDWIFDVIGIRSSTSSTTMSITLDYPKENSSYVSRRIPVECNFTSTGQSIEFISAEITNMSGSSFWNDGIYPLPGATTYTYSNTAAGSLNASGTYNFTCYGYGSLGVNRTVSSIFYLVDILTNTANYNATSQITAPESYKINITAINVVPTSAIFNYNGTTYASSISNVGQDYIFINSKSAPSTIGNYSFYWNVSLSNGSNYITSTYYQNVLTLTGITLNNNCPAGTSPAFNFTFADEENLSGQTAATINYNLAYGLSGNSSGVNIYGNFSNLNKFSICINNSSPTFLIGYGEISYQVTGYQPRKFFLFQNTRLTNITVSNTLYSLLTTSAQVFQVKAQQTSLNPYAGYYLSTLRWYPSLNSYNVVEMAKTDDTGNANLYVQLNTATYRIGLYSVDGTLIKLINPLTMTCQVLPCTYTLYANPGSADLTTWGNIQQNLSFNPSTKLYTFTWNDPSQATTMMNLTVWQDSSSGTTQLCSSSAASFTGILTCDVSAYSGTLRAEVWRSASPPNLISQLINDIRTTFAGSAEGRGLGLLLGILLLIFFALMGSFSPVLVIILGIISLVPLLLLGNLTWVALVAIGVLGGIVLHFLKRIT